MLSRLLVLAVLPLLGACGLDRIDVSVSSSTTVQGSPLGGVLEFAPFGGDFARFDFGQSQELRNQGVSKGDIDSARLRTFRLSIAQGASFERWLDEIAFYVEADGLPRQLVAQASGISDSPTGTTVLDLSVTDVELKPYVTAPAMTFSAEATGRPPAEDTVVDADAVVRVDVDASPF